jgi:hypothetical protein
MDDTKDAASALDALVKDKSTARSRSGVLRELLPQIEQAQNAGISHTQILTALNERGLGLNLKSYNTILWRIRHKAKKTGAAMPQSPGAKAPDGFTPEQEVKRPALEQDTSDEPASDALEATRRREERSRRFISDETTNPLLSRLKGKP